MRFCTLTEDVYEQMVDTLRQLGMSTKRRIRIISDVISASCCP
ncbi:MAG: hypothetical protein ACI8ZB_002500 [Desulforhopalus sp.]|jgi:hypothetical protein